MYIKEVATLRYDRKFRRLEKLKRLFLGSFRRYVYYENRGQKKIETIRNSQIEDFAEYLIENASEAFEHQDRELLEKAIERYFQD